MMIERHYDDETLIALIDSDRLLSDTHLPACTPCSQKLESFQFIAEALRDRDTWDTREIHLDPVPATIANLRSFADHMTAEDAAADLILPELLAGPREEWMPRLQEHPEWRTAGVVRKLVAATDRAIDTMPPDAVELTLLATDVADHLDPDDYPSDTVARLRGAAWRERAYALFYTGDFVKAEQAVDRADAEFAKCVVDEYDRARLSIVKAIVMRPLERFDEATDVAASSSAVFGRFGDLRRLASSSMAQVGVLISRSHYDRAIAILQDLELRLRNVGDEDTYARVVANLGNCMWRTDRLSEAVQHYELASMIFDALGNRTEATRNRWNIGLILARDGRTTNAAECFRKVIREFEAVSMCSEAAIASLDLSELLLADGRFSEVDELCRSAIRSFERAGIATSQQALMALAYIQEATRQRVASQSMVRHVREYIRRLPHEPTLLFAEPPLS